MSEFIEIPANKSSLAQRGKIHGFGVNDASYATQPKKDGKKSVCPFYQAWVNMIKRCYCPKFHAKHPTYKDCEVCDEWVKFSSFKKWMEKQSWKGKHLDKDLKIIGNKKYSPETCLFIDQSVNKLLSDAGGIRGRWPIGVCLDKKNNKFMSKCSYKDRTIFLGYYSNPEDAHKAYSRFKAKIIIETASEEKNQYIKEYLLNLLENKSRLTL